MNELERLFAEKFTENGDDTYNTTGNNLLDILFMTAYFEKHLREVKIGQSEREKLFAMFIRDPRFGIGRRDLGRYLMYMAGVNAENIVKAGRYDDLLYSKGDYRKENLMYLYKKAEGGDQLAKKWLPRLTGKDKTIAEDIRRLMNVSYKKYRQVAKVQTTESLLSEKRIDEINYEHVPSLAMIKYYKRFMREEKFRSYIDEVKSGEKKLNVSTTTVYDIYKNSDKIDADLFFDKIEKIDINCLVILDSSGSMFDDNDSIGKALSIGHYLSKCSSYCTGQFISFSKNPKLITIGYSDPGSWASRRVGKGRSNYSKEIQSMATGEVANTDFGKVMNLLKKLKAYPEYIVVLSDMEFDSGSKQSKEELQRIWKENRCQTKIVWWNLNSRNKTVPELDEMGNIYMSGYSPMLLKYLESGFDGSKFLTKLLTEYAKNINF